MQILFLNLEKITLTKEITEKYLLFLSVEEKTRFHNIQNQVNQRNFLFGRFLIRDSLSKILNCPLSQIKLKTSENGRPQLNYPQENLEPVLKPGFFEGFLGKTKSSTAMYKDIHEERRQVLTLKLPKKTVLRQALSFNLSHSKDLVVLGISENQIGIDVEFMKERNFEKLAKYHFTAKEIEFLQLNNFSKKLFYSYWTLKEAFVKCNDASIFNPNFILECFLDKSGKIKTAQDAEYQFFTREIKEDYQISAAIKGIQRFEKSLIIKEIFLD